MIYLGSKKNMKQWTANEKIYLPKACDLLLLQLSLHFFNKFYNLCFFFTWREYIYIPHLLLQT